MDNAHVVITGAAGAIGSALAREFAGRFKGVRLSLCDRDPRVTQTAESLPADARGHEWDLARGDDLPGELSALVDQRGPVDVLVNCAGVMDVGSVIGLDWQLTRRMLEVNLFAPLQLMSLTTPGMVKRRRGGVINVTSMAGVTPLRGMSGYGATKAGLSMASEIARLELAPHEVRVVTVYPGPVYSELEKNARAQFKHGLVSRAVPTGDPDEIATLIVDAFVRGRPRVAYPFAYRIAHRIPRLSGWFTSRFSPPALR